MTAERRAAIAAAEQQLDFSWAAYDNCAVTAAKRGCNTCDTTEGKLAHAKVVAANARYALLADSSWKDAQLPYSLLASGGHEVLRRAKPHLHKLLRDAERHLEQTQSKRTSSMADLQEDDDDDTETDEPESAGAGAGAGAGLMDRLRAEYVVDNRPNMRLLAETLAGDIVNGAFDEEDDDRYAYAGRALGFVDFPLPYSTQPEEEPSPRLRISLLKRISREAFEETQANWLQRYTDGRVPTEAERRELVAELLLSLNQKFDANRYHFHFSVTGHQ